MWAGLRHSASDAGHLRTFAAINLKAKSIFLRTVYIHDNIESLQLGTCCRQGEEDHPDKILLEDMKDEEESGLARTIRVPTGRINLIVNARGSAALACWDFSTILAKTFKIDFDLDSLDDVTEKCSRSGRQNRRKKSTYRRQTRDPT